MALSNYRNTPSTPYAPPYSKYYPTEYFSGVDISIFFKDGSGGEPLYIDEVNAFNSTMTERIVPVYSYAGYIPNRIQHGARLVQGSFRINQKPGNYLHEILNGANNIINPGLAPTPLLASYSRPDPVLDPDGYASWQNSLRTQYWTAIESASTPIAQESDLGTIAYFTNSSFTILIVSGDIDTVDLTRNNGRIRTIENVNIFSVESSMDLSGEANQETFSFTACDINASQRINPFL